MPCWRGRAFTVEGGTAGPCAALRSVEKHLHERSAELQIPPLRCAPVGMTKGRGALPLRVAAGKKKLQIPPLRCAPVGMTKGRGTLPLRVVAGKKKLQIPPLRCAPVGMTKGRGALPLRVVAGKKKLQIPPLRCAPVGMTKGRGALPLRVVAGKKKLQIPPLRFAPVGMTKGGLGHHLMVGYREGQIPQTACDCCLGKVKPTVIPPFGKRLRALLRFPSLPAR